MNLFSKWFFEEDVPIDDVYKRLYELEAKVQRLEEENIETSNTLYEIMNSIEAVDRRIDIIAERCRINYDV
jgi:predicted RNase H-like nuclease (RuvC/YqgF family)